MDGEIPNAPNVAQPEQTPKKGLLFEILFVIIFLILIFGALNYFNILRLSEIFPDLLGFLPRKEVPTGTSQQSLSPTLSPTNRAKQTLINFLPTILAPSFLPQSPSDITLAQDSQNINSFNASWNTQEERITSGLHMSQDFRKITSLDLYIQELQQPLSPSVESAKSSASQIFSITPKGQWGCKNVLSSRLYCENFWDEQNSRKGLGFLIVTATGSSRLVFSFCEHSKNSNYYSWKSCRSEFLKTGVE